MSAGKSISWSDPLPLAQYRSAPKGMGIYAIGRARDPSQPVLPSIEYDAYMFNWPDNLVPLYVGISESRGEGVRRRVRSHFKGKGNRKVAGMIAAGEQLWFVTAAGQQVVNFEALFLIAFTPETGFIANKRSETKNFARRLVNQIDAELLAKGIDPNDQPWQRDPDYFRDG